MLKKCRSGSAGVEKRWKPSGNRTTTNRCSTKTSTTFCVFLLTENFLPLILRIQIRGNVEAPDGSRRGCAKVRAGGQQSRPSVEPEEHEREYRLARVHTGRD